MDHLIVHVQSEFPVGMLADSVGSSDPPPIEVPYFVRVFKDDALCRPCVALNLVEYILGQSKVVFAVEAPSEAGGDGQIFVLDTQTYTVRDKGRDDCCLIKVSQLPGCDSDVQMMMQAPQMQLPMEMQMEMQMQMQMRMQTPFAPAVDGSVSGSAQSLRYRGSKGGAGGRRDAMAQTPGLGSRASRSGGAMAGLMPPQTATYGLATNASEWSKWADRMRKVLMGMTAARQMCWENDRVVLAVPQLSLRERFFGFSLSAGFEASI